MNQPRRLEVLSAIVEDYVHSREPVGSKALVERHRLGVSSATVRNDMAALEEEGLIMAPHASAGRIPTDKGYRAFVDRIQTVKPLSGAERRAIVAFLDSSEDLDEALARTVRLLSQLTHQVAVLQYPTHSGDRLRHLDLVPMGRDEVLVVLITGRGRVLQRTVDLGAERPGAGAVPEETDLDRIRAAFLDRLREQPLEQAEPLLSAALARISAPQRALAARLASAVVELAASQREDRLLMAGTSYLAQATGDFSTSIAPILDVLEEQVVMLRLLSELDDARDVAVRIGRENLETPLADASVVASGYGPSRSSKLAVVGPTRMDYPTTMSAVQAVAQYLSRILHE